jgi:hypothetical protein
MLAGPGAAHHAAPGIQRQPTLDVAGRHQDESLMAEAPPEVSQVLAAPGAPLDAPTRAFFEPRIGRDLGGVRVHTDARAAASSRAIHARAYTQRNHIVFGDRQFAPGHADGQRVLAHELVHVLQGSVSTVHRAEAEGQPEVETAPIELPEAVSP